MKIAIHNAQFSSHVGGTERLIYYQIKNLLNIPGVKITLITKKTNNPSIFFKEIKHISNGNLRIIELKTKNMTNNYNSNNPLKWHLESLEFGLCTNQIYQ